MTLAQAAGPETRKDAPGYEPVSRSDPFSILVAEHALLRQQFARALLALQDGDDSSAIRAALMALSESLRLHQRREDIVLYPVCERLFGGKGGAASVLRDDHAALAGQLEALTRECESVGRVSRLRLDMLRNEADGHFGKEERVLFPLTAALLSGTETSDLARRLRSLRPTPSKG